MEERDDNGNQLISDNNIIGLMADLIAGGKTARRKSPPMWIIYKKAKVNSS